MGLGALTFLNPWLLAGLATLPLIYWLLRTVPPRPRIIDFPPTRILVDLDNRDNTPAKSPWWLMLIRLLAAALVIFALADPILNPDRSEGLTGSGPVVLIIDNGWASAAHWPDRRAALDRLIGEAEHDGRAIIIVPTAYAAKRLTLRLESPANARSSAAAIEPEPFAPRRDSIISPLAALLKKQRGVSIVWLSDGIDHDAKAHDFAVKLKAIVADGSITVIDIASGREALGVTASLGRNGRLVATILRSQGAVRQGQLYAFSARGQRLSEASFTLGGNETRTKVDFDIPLELRNQVTRLEIAGERSAGAVNLLDARSQWHRIGLISGGASEEDQPLLAPLYYIDRAMRPFAELVRAGDANVTAGIELAMARNASILMLADIGTITGELAKKVNQWVKKGGVLVRFAGPRLEQGGDALLPADLRIGGRSLGGALSWSTPQPLAPFNDDTPFAGLAVSKDVLIKRQVLTDPTRMSSKVKIWARLKDGTPLVTARQLGDGEIILFHVTANSDWSNLPLSGLFVEMLRRITSRGQLGGPTNNADGDKTLDTKTQDEKSTATLNRGTTGKVLAPVQVLSGFGILKPPSPTSQAISAKRIFQDMPSASHPPGYYGPAGNPRAFNVIGAKTTLRPLPSMPSGIARRVMETAKSTALKPWLLAGALTLLFADIIAILLLQAGGNLMGALSGGSRSKTGATAGAVLLALGLGLGLTALLPPKPAMAQQSGANEPFLSGPRYKAKSRAEQFVLRATGKVTFGFVLTGDETTDRISFEGLSGLAKRLQRRTAVEPGPPAGINILNDEIALFPVLYWPVLPDAKALPDKILAKIDAYMKQGGMIIFDTKDFAQGLPTSFAMSRNGTSALQRLLGKLDIPRLEPVPHGHVLTKSFYLLNDFPGRWNGGKLWVEADAGGSTDGTRKARRADGVSAILVTSNDFAAAWALDEDGRALYPTVPGSGRQREMAVRTGINIVMYALTGNYKGDQVHIPDLLKRLGQ